MEASLAPAQNSRIVGADSLSPRDLDSLLTEETFEWETKLDWDFSATATVLRRLAEERRLGGAALIDCGEVAGYGYASVKEHKGSIAGLYVRRPWRGGRAGSVLFAALLDALIRKSRVRRIECQLALLPALPKSLLFAASVRPFERILMKRNADPALPPCPASASRRFRIEPWGSGRDGSCDAAARILSLAYAGHVDSQINDLYRTPAGAGRLLKTVFPAVSFVAFDGKTGSAAGLALGSFVARGVGHINQLCVTPSARDAGLGYELMRRSIDALRAAGAVRISLMVTADNKAAIQFYTGCGFGEAHRFFAYVWDAAETPD